MKEIMAILRPNKMKATKDVLEALGFPSMTACRVLGRGKQKAIVEELKTCISIEDKDNSKGTMRYVPKRLMSIVVNDEDVSLVVEAIMKINHTGNIGDGKIFVSDIENAVRIRTGEEGVAAL